MTNFTLLRLEPSLGARARPKQPVTFRPRSESPHHGAGQQVSSLGPQLSTAGQHQGKVQQQSRSLDERRSRISRQRNSSFSSLSLTAEKTRLSHYLSSAPRPDLRPDPRPDLRPDPSQPAAPPTITVRRPSMTCGLQPGGNSERNLSATVGRKKSAGVEHGKCARAKSDYNSRSIAENFCSAWTVYQTKSGK